MTLPAGTGSALGWRGAHLAGVQVIYFARLLILAHLLAPDAFGLLAIATVAIGVFTRLSDLGLIQALVQRDDATDEEFDAAWTTGLLRALAIAVLLVIAAPWIAALFGEPRAAPIVRVLAIRPVVDAAASIGTARLTRELRFGALAGIHVPAAFLDLVVAVSLAPSLGVWALVAGSLGGAAASTVLSYALAPHRPRFMRVAVAAPLLRYGRWVLLTSILALAGSSLTQLMLSRSLGAAALGVYFLASKVAFAPVDAAGAVAGAVAFPLFASARDDAQARSAFHTFFTGQMLLLVPAYALLLALAPALEDTLGARWAGAAPVIQLLGFACVIGMLGEIVVPLLMGRGRPDRVLVLEAVQTGLLLTGVLVLIPRLGVTGAAIAWLIANALTQLVVVRELRAMIDTPLRWTRRRIAGSAAAALAALLAARVAILLVDGLPGLVIAALVGLMAAGATLHLLDGPLALGLRAFVQLTRGTVP